MYSLLKDCLFVKDRILDRKYSTIDFKVVEHEYETRSRNALYYQCTRTNVGKSAISYIGPCLYNYVPDSISELSGFFNYKEKLKLWLLEESQLDKLSKLRLLS